MADPHYDQMFRRLEGVRWELADIDFESIDRSKVEQRTLDFVRVNCLMELSSLYATRMFLRDFRHDADFCQFISVWYYEEMKHYLALREYLKAHGQEPDVSMFDELDVELEPADWRGTISMHFVGELRLGMWYHRWSEVFAYEPVLSRIYREIGNDEYRHAQCYEQFMASALERDSAVLLPFLNAAKFMLLNPEGDKHPTTFEGAADGTVTDRIEGYEAFKEQVVAHIDPSDEDELAMRVLKTLSRLAGRELANKGDLVMLTRELATAESVA